MTVYERPFGRCLEDFVPGDVYRHWPGKTITEADDHLFCMITMNHHPLHTDAHYAETETQFGKNVVVGNLVYSLVLGMSVPDVSGKAIANLEVESLKHAKPTFHGDTIYAHTTVLDKVPSKSEGWGENRFRDAGFRAVPGAIVRRSAFIARNVVLMPSFVNLGAYVDEATMIDTWSTVGSCAQIGKRVHISGGVGIGGVLEPLQAEPVIVEDDCFIGARSEVAEGVIVRKGAVLAMGVFLGASTKIVDRETGEVFMGEVPEYSVVVPGALPGKPMKNGQIGPSTACAVIVKRVDERTRSKTSINELLRD